MLELSILGFLAEAPLHGYELRNRLSRLAGHARPVSDGSLYPAINRMVQAGRVDRQIEPGTSAAQRHTLSLTPAGRTELMRRLREPSDLEISDSTRFFTILAFLSQLPSVAEQHAVLRRRLEFLSSATGFFREKSEDPYRLGMLTVAKATSRAERVWLNEILSEPRA